MVTCAGAFSSYYHPAYHPVMAVIGLILPGLLILNLWLALYWGFRKKYWIWFPVIAVLANLNYLSSVIQYNKDHNSGGYSLKVATFNVRVFNRETTGYTAKEIARYMNEENVDIISLQEFGWNTQFTKDSIYNAFRAYPYKTVPVEDGKTRIALFSKYPIRSSYFIPFRDSENCGMWADVLINDTVIRVYNVHMQTTNLNSSRSKLAKSQRLDDINGEERALSYMKESLLDNFGKRAEQACLIRNLIDKSPYPVIVCGDFNDTPASFTYRKLKGSLKDSFIACGNGYGYTYRGMWRMFRIDYIFYSQHMRGTDYYSPQFKWSDHNPVITRLEFDY